MPRNRIARSYGSSTFIFLRNLHTVFCSGCTNVHAPQCRKVPFCLHPLQHLLSLDFFFLRVAPEAYGSSQARGGIGAAAAGLCHTQAMLDLSHVCDLHYSSWQRWIPGPWSEARDWTCVLIDTSQICFCWAMTGTPVCGFFWWRPF